jgi:hypothetical protein
MAHRILLAKRLAAKRRRLSELDETDSDDGKLVDLTRRDAADDAAAAVMAKGLVQRYCKDTPFSCKQQELTEMESANSSTLHTAICPSSAATRSSQLIESSSVPSQSTSRMPVTQGSRYHYPCLQAKELVNLN